VRPWVVAVGKRYARLTAHVVTAHPRLWRIFRPLMRRQFDGLAPSWEKTRSDASFAVLDAALARLPAPPRRILDVGTGTGLAARALAERVPGATVDAVDLSPRMVEQAEALLLPGLAGRVRFQAADAAALPFADGSFDLVVLLNAIAFPEELARVIAPGGTVVIAFSQGPSTPIWTPPEILRKRLAAAGFTDLEGLAAGPATALVARYDSEPRAR
jgi:ubiquinone/menaquinone biosynthesis C-methylase UbiE